MSEKQIFVQGDYYEQSGNHGAGHISDSDFKGQAKLGGISNEAKESINNTCDQKIKNTKFLEITISGEFESIDLADILRIQSELVSKLKNTKRTNINIVDAQEGSIKLTFEGSEDELKQIQALIQSGDITELSGKKIENARLIDSESEAQELKKQVNNKNQLVQELKQQNSIDITARNLEHADLKFCDLKNIFLKQADLREANLSFANLYCASLSNANLYRADLNGADLSNANLYRADLNGASLSNANLYRAILSGASLYCADLSGASLSNANLYCADLNGASLSNANLYRTNLYRANLYRADLNGANLYCANLRNTRISDETKLAPKWRIVWEIVNQNANGKDLSREDLSNADLRYVSFVEARLVQAKLNGSRLNNANLTKANLIGADLSNAELLNANLTDADLSGAKVEKARFGYNKGISADIKRDLESRGAIFEDSPGDLSKAKIPTPV